MILSIKTLCLRISGIRIGTVTNCLQHNKTFYEHNWLNFHKTTLHFKRIASLSTTSIKEVLKLRKVTGFRLSWKYTTNSTKGVAKSYNP